MRTAVGRALAAAVLILPVPAAARTVCTIVADAADGRILLEQGDCRRRVTPASTFKIALSLIGFETGFLRDVHHPSVPFQDGYADWGGANWRRTTDPTDWMKYSVVWYSRLISHGVGADRLSDFARRFGYGNADLSGDPGQDNGLDRAWISSSLRIAPVEQVAFLHRLVSGRLPVSAATMAATAAIIEVRPAADGWTIHGKTGAAFPRRADGDWDEEHGYGWYVGWAVRADHRLVFARLNQDDRKQTVSTGLRTRDDLVRDWPALAASLGR